MEMIDIKPSPEDIRALTNHFLSLMTPENVKERLPDGSILYEVIEKIEREFYVFSPLSNGQISSEPTINSTDKVTSITVDKNLHVTIEQKSIYGTITGGFDIGVTSLSDNPNDNRD